MTPSLSISLSAVDAAVRNRLFALYVEPRLAAIRRSVEIMTFAGEDADDNLQEVLLHLLGVIHQYDPAQAAPSTWLSRVVTNFMNDLHDREAVRRRREPDVLAYDEAEEAAGGAVADGAAGADGAAPSFYSATRRGTQGGLSAAAPSASGGVVLIEAGVRPEDYPATYGALMQLSVQRRGVLLRYAAGHSVAEIAAALGCSPGAVSTTLHRAKAQMRNSLTTHSKNSVYDSFQQL